ncbi:glutathione S-transferase family protein [Pseudahrensia aquimaris]|uniref:Glutathione S-transferase family protein n=1 Tax=Pseudahrensia aquimaris TaxID=744461 RepID=A0ABW3FBG1_9HYPH
MGLLVDGEWKDQWYDTKKSGGKFVRSDAGFRNWITTDGSAGPTGEGGFKAEVGRYHLYISHACPWANRAAIFRTLKGLEDAIDVSVVHHFMAEDGWTFELEEGATGDKINGFPFMRDVYTAAKPDYTGRVTVPVLWDKERQTIVSNESSEIIRMFNSAFDGIGDNSVDYYPADLQPEIDAINERVYHTVNNGVYKCGFATTSEAYEEAFQPLFESLDWLEDLLSTRRYLAGAQITEADWRLFTTLIRFDPVYVGHFKCNRNRIVDMPNLWNHTLELYQWPGVAETINMRHIKRHYYASHETINPTRIVPLGPNLDYSAPHDRARFD